MVRKKKEEDKYKEEEYVRYTMSEVVDAVLDENNLPRCPNCGELLSISLDYKMVTVNGVKYTQFIKRCGKCKTVGQYCTDVSIENRYVFNINDIKNVKCTVSKEDE